MSGVASLPSYLAVPMETISNASDETKKGQDALKAFLLQISLLSVALTTSILSTLCVSVTMVMGVLISLPSCMGLIDPSCFDNTLEALKEFTGLAILSLLMGIFVIVDPIKSLMDRCRG